MRDLACAALAAGVLALTGSPALAKPEAKPKAPERVPAAAAAESYGVKTAYANRTGKGYTARERHMADCLASYPGYDPKTDRVVVRPGLTRRCEL